MVPIYTTHGTATENELIL